jgi:hypothetical protein
MQTEGVMEPHQARTPDDEERLDAIVADTFPASDAPAWNATHAGQPVQRIVPLEPTPEAMRAQLRTDVERLSRAVPDPNERRKAREEAVSRALLASGRAVVREPVDDAFVVRTLECEQLGSMREASCIVVGARYDEADVSGIAAMLAVARALAGVDLVRSVRFVALADAVDGKGGAVSGAVRYVDRLAKAGVSVHAMLMLARFDLRDHEAPVLVVGNLASRVVVRRATHAFAMASRIGVRALSLPSWFPGVGRADHAAFWRYGWPAVMVADGPLWRGRSTQPPDVDRIAAAVPGLVTAATRLAET